MFFHVVTHIHLFSYHMEWSHTVLLALECIYQTTTLTVSTQNAHKTTSTIAFSKATAVQITEMKQESRVQKELFLEIPTIYFPIRDIEGRRTLIWKMSSIHKIILSQSLIKVKMDARSKF